MTQYLLSVHGSSDDAMPAPEVMRAMYDDVETFNAELQSTGVWVYANGLEPADIATVVDGTGPELVMTDGPYLETKEHIGGFWITDLADLDAAIAWASKGSAACQGPVEVRPMQPDPEPAS